MTLSESTSRNLCDSTIFHLIYLFSADGGVDSDDGGNYDGDDDGVDGGDDGGADGSNDSG